MNALSPITLTTDIAPLRAFVGGLAALLDATDDERTILRHGGALLDELIARDDWLPDTFAQPSAERYQQYLLHCDSRERFSVVSFVWAPGQATPIHDHRTWGLVGMLRGSEQVERFERGHGGALVATGTDLIHQGAVDAVSPRIGDVHRVSNGRSDGPSVSIHVYGANIGAVERATYAPDGTAKRFISGYASSVIPNLWDRSRAA